MQQVDGRKLWLDEGLAYAGKFLTQALEIEKGRKLSPAEERFKQVSAAYIYLHDFLTNLSSNAIFAKSTSTIPR